MKCENVRNILNEYIDGELNELAARRVSQHLLACESCAREEKHYRKVSDLVSACGFQKAPEGLLNSIHIGLEKERPFGKNNAYKKIVALAASFLIVLAGGYYIHIFNALPPQNEIAYNNDTQNESANLPDSATTGLYGPENYSGEPSRIAAKRMRGSRSQAYSRRLIQSAHTRGDILAASPVSGMGEGARARAGMIRAINARERRMASGKYKDNYYAAAPEDYSAGSFADSRSLSSPDVDTVAYSSGNRNSVPFEYYEASNDTSAVDNMIARNIESLRRTRSGGSADTAAGQAAPQSSSQGSSEAAVGQHATGTLKSLYARGSITFEVADPVAAAENCENFISGLVGTGSDVVWQRHEDLIIVSGKFSTLASLRAYSLNACSSDAEPKLSQKEIDSQIAASARSQNISPDYPAILELHFVQ